MCEKRGWLESGWLQGAVPSTVLSGADAHSALGRDVTLLHPKQNKLFRERSAWVLLARALGGRCDRRPRGIAAAANVTAAKSANN